MTERQTVTVEQLKDLTPASARELLVECFFQAQKETFLRAAVSLRHEVPPDAELRKTVEGAVRFAFRSVKADFQNPTPQSLVAVIGKLAEQASAMGTPADIIAHHKQQLSRVVAALEE